MQQDGNLSPDLCLELQLVSGMISVIVLRSDVWLSIWFPYQKPDCMSEEAGDGERISDRLCRADEGLGNTKEIA